MNIERDNAFELLLAQWFDLALGDFGFITRAIEINRGHAAIEAIKDKAFRAGYHERTKRGMNAPHYLGDV